MDYEIFLLSVILRQTVIKSNQTLKIVECVSWREENEKEGENKNTKLENSRNR